MVRKFVSVPPSQRLMTKYAPARRASSWHDLLRLALRADEQDVAAAGDGLGDEVERALEEARRLVEVDDVDAVARAVDERPHLRVPALGLVTEVDARVEELAHAERLVRITERARSAVGFDCGGVERGCRAFWGWISLSSVMRSPFGCFPPPRRSTNSRFREHRVERSRAGRVALLEGRCARERSESSFRPGFYGKIVGLTRPRRGPGPISKPRRARLAPIPL